MGLKLGSGIGLVLFVSLVTFVLMSYLRVSNHSPPAWKAGSARLPCLANNYCPMGQQCSNGFCSEGFMDSIRPPVDASSCTAKECQGINAPCARSANPCGEGTFCHNNSCVNIVTPDQGEAYNQIGMLDV